MRRVDFLIQAAREISRTTANEDATVPVSDQTIIQYLNDAKNRLATLFLGLKNVQRPFMTEKTISVVANQAAYSIPDRVALNKHIHQVMYSHSGNASDYVLLPKLNTFNRDLDTTTYPSGYYVANGQIVLTAVPASSGGLLRVMYDRALDDLDKRRGQITVVTGLTSTGFTSITIGTSPDETSVPNLSTIDYVCVNDLDGNVKAYNIPVLSYVTGTDVLTPRVGFTFQTGETITAGDYVTFNKYSTTHCKLPDECERYLIHYAAQSIFQQESSGDSIVESQMLQAIEQDLVKSFATQTGEIQWWPTLNYQDW